MNSSFVKDPYDEGVEAYKAGLPYDLEQHPRWQEGYNDAAWDDAQ